MNNTLTVLEKWCKPWTYFTSFFIFFVAAVVVIGCAIIVILTFNLYPNAAASITGIDTATNSQALIESGFFTLGAAVTLVVLFYVRRILICIKKNNTPFTDEIIRSLTIITGAIFICVIAAAATNLLFPSVFSTLSDMISLYDLVIPFGLSMALLLTFLTYVFKYGTELQKESDETL